MEALPPHLYGNLADFIGNLRHSRKESGVFLKTHKEQAIDRFALYRYWLLLFEINNPDFDHITHVLYPFVLDE